MDSLLHDARNPLNALAINLDVLSEKIKAANGGIPPSHEKNLAVMREQIFRVDAVLRQFSEFLAPRPSHPGEVDLSDIVQRAVDLLQYEARRNQVRLSASIERGILLGLGSGDVPRTLALVASLRGVLRGHEGAEVVVTLSQKGSDARLEVRDGRHAAFEPLPDAVAALEQLSKAVQLSPDACTVTISGGDQESGADL